MTKNEANTLHKTSSNHYAFVKEASNCGCFYCQHVFSPNDIKIFLTEEHGSQTALCPNCNIDAVLPGITSPEILKEMNERYFQTTIPFNRGILFETKLLVHNVIAHPISGVLWFASDLLNKAADKLHSFSLPEGKGYEDSDRN